eukprot:TRINITY_DN48230_c0_g1_i1.p1 TRINITY_DN48230_c0_g1~~TRINITY_DN48230_c0_g1_i1.p1  ORF type:complete len:529 (+),score=89.44 TRINITY_DN48230_c0_g1_i1:39-1625(+)
MFAQSLQLQRALPPRPSRTPGLDSSTSTASSSSSSSPKALQWRPEENPRSFAKESGWTGTATRTALALGIACCRRQQRLRRQRSTRNAFNGSEEECPNFLYKVLPLEEWLSKVKLHNDLARDIDDRFGNVPQQAASAVHDAVARIERGARQCIAPSASAHPFGSTVNGFGEASSDLDILIAVEDEELCYYMSYVEWQKREQRYQEAMTRNNAASGGFAPDMPRCNAINGKAATAFAVQQLADFLPELGFQVVRVLPRARRPLVTLVDRTGELSECDVSINNRLPLTNTELLASYSRLDPRVRSLVLLVKVWAKGKGVCGANLGNLSSYAWTIMVIYWLQLIDLLPSLQELETTARTVPDVDFWGYERDFETKFMPAEDYLHGVKTGKIDSCKGEEKRKFDMADLLYSFFCFFYKEYEWGSEVVSIRKPDRRKADTWWRLYGKPQSDPGIHVEDPIELRDLNIVVKRDRLAQLKAEFAQATELLEKGCSLEEFLSSPPLPPVQNTFLVRRAGQRNRRIRGIRLPRIAET